jgi:lipopolysaccharide/colanic/teichoic acid biosynthesis glycosyltransferase
LDELPQLLDVWLGNMSLVGPRPEVPRYVYCYPDDVREVVLSVRPGITDRASIEFKDENEILGHAVDPHVAYVQEVLPIKLRYYQDYVARRSFWSDIAIILSTLKSLVR